MVITSNLVFSQWDQIFKDRLTTAAAIDRVVHHSRIIEFGPEMTSVRAEQAARRQQQQTELKQQEVLKQQQTTVLNQNQPDQGPEGQI